MNLSGKGDLSAKILSKEQKNAQQLKKNAAKGKLFDQMEDYRCKA